MSLSEPPEEHLRLVELEAAVLADVEAYGRCPLADKPRVSKLSAGIQDRLGRIRALTRDLELAAEEAEGEEEEQRALAALLAQHKAEYARIQAAFRQAAVDQRTAALKSAAEERRELLAGGEAGLRQRRAQTEADAAALAEDVTGGLRRTRQVLAEELEHTSATLAAMEASHTQLGKTRDEYHGQHRHLRKSKGLLGTLDWQAKSETYMLWFGLTLFLAVCAYIFQKRAGHFVPNALKPTTLLAGRQPVPAPATLRRSPAVPLHKAGAHRQPVSVTHQPPPHMPRHQHRRPPASPAPATQQQGEPQVGGGDEAVWPSGSPEPGTDQQQQQVPSQQQPPQQAGKGVPLPPPPAPLDQPPPQPPQPQPQPQTPEQPVQLEQAEEQQKPAGQQQPDLLEPIPAEPQAQPAQQAGGEAQPAPSKGDSQVPAEAQQQQAPEEQQAAGAEQVPGQRAVAEQQAPEQQAASGGAAHAEVHPSPVGAGQQGASEAELAAAAAEAAAAALPAEAVALEQAAADAGAAAAVEVAAGEAAASQAVEHTAAASGTEAEGQAAGEEPPAVGPEGAPEPDRHIIVDRQGRRIAVDPTAEFVRSPLGGQPAGEPGGEEAPRDEL